MARPNFLVLLTDEQRADTMAAYGNRVIQTPNLDRLAAQSTVFSRAYCTQPVCTPSRASLQTGLYPHQHACIENNAALSASRPTLAEMLPPGVYATGYNGKWHLGDEVFAQRGYEDWVSTEDFYRRYFSAGRDRDASASYTAFLREQGIQPRDGRQFGRSETARLPEEFSKPCYQAREACRFIRAHRRHPFFLCVSFLEPHMPFFGPRDGQYRPAEVSLPGNFDALPGPDQPLRSRVNQRWLAADGYEGCPLGTEQDWREMIAHYWGLCSLVDTHVGTILACLEECGLMDNTAVVFTSDHGDMMGSHRMLTKCVQFEEAIRIPLCVRLPGQRGGRVIERPVSQIDLVPTLLDLAGAPPHPLPGRSLRALLEGAADVAPSPTVVEWNGATASELPKKVGDEYPEWAVEVAARGEILQSFCDPVRTWIDLGGWKLNYSQLGEHELYHLPSDPGETANQAFIPGRRFVFEEMRRRLATWCVETEDHSFLEGSDLVNAAI